MQLFGDKKRMIQRAAREVQPGMLVNLGIGYPTQIVNHIPANSNIWLHAENGIVGAGEELPYDQANRNLIDAGGGYVSTIPGTSFMDSAVSFALVRSGRLDLTALGAFEIAENGDLANWIIPGKSAPGAGGAIELAQRAKRVIVLTTHVDKKGAPKLLEKCRLPLTAKSCVSRIYTDLAVIDITDQGMVLKEIAEGVSVADVKNATEANLMTSQDQLPTF